MRQITRILTPGPPRYSPGATAAPALTEAWQAAGHSAQLLDDLLDLSRLEAGAFKLTPHPLVPETSHHLTGDENGPITEVAMEPTLRDMERRGFEPLTPWLQTRCSPS